MSFMDYLIDQVFINKVNIAWKKSLFMSLVLHPLFFFLIIIYAAKVSRVLHPLENAMSTLCTLEITDKTDYQRQVFGVYNDNKPRWVIYAIKIPPYTTQNKKHRLFFR